MSGPATVLLAAAVALLLAVLVAVGAGKLARLDGAAHPAAILRAATAFASSLTLIAVVTAALAAVLR
ncbi:hypothetical protein QRN89_10225 [Streptomyces chengbuensis]|uniref:hypothetical protein n=1 Tax=Streptomyces TaxID=1883 RepID=UPI0025B4B440|nr:hypothetical protein [Streptomyces sp. HUAS CB01]WJY50165.1 hypothetical protein QRN89_10225 [Streptomyces sp. HUAS CB01]